jgi:GNAT superfamily N-acetyltransferase
MEGRLFAFGLRRVALVGFAICVLKPELAFRGKLTAMIDLVYVSPEYRGEGTRILLAEVEKCMRDKGAWQLSLHHAAEKGVLAPIGAAWRMQVWTKRL